MPTSVKTRKTGVRARSSTGQARVTARDVAKAAKVSLMSVSLAFKPDSRLSEATRKRVLAAAAKVNYVPDRAAQLLRKGHSDVIAFIVNDVTNPFYGTMMQLVQQVTEKQGRRVMFLSSDWSTDRERKLVDQILSARVQGVLACPTGMAPFPADAFYKAGVPVIGLDTIPSDPKLAHVVNDHQQSGALVAKHLLDLGCQDLVFFGMRAGRDNDAHTNLGKGFTGAIKARKKRLRKDAIQHVGMFPEDGRAAVKALIKAKKLPDAIFCINDLCAMGVMDALDAAGVVPGRDVAIVGVDDMATSDLKRISLTSLREPFEQMAQLAVEHLLSCIESGKKAAIKKKLSAELVVRDSSKKFRMPPRN